MGWWNRRTSAEKLLLVVGGCAAVGGVAAWACGLRGIAVLLPKGKMFVVSAKVVGAFGGATVGAAGRGLAETANNNGRTAAA